MKINKKIQAKLIGITLPLVLIILWQGIASAGYVSPHIMPLPAKVLTTVAALFRDDGLLLHITVSLKRVFSGFLIGIVSGFLFGLLIGLSRTSEKIFAPTFHALRQVPMVGWIPLIVMWFGMSELPRIIVIAIGAFYPAVINTFAGVRNVPREYLELASVYGYRGLKLIGRIIIPSALPAIITGFTLSLGMSWMILVAAELLIETPTGIGTVISTGRETYSMEMVAVGIITVGILGYAMTMMVERFAGVVERGRIAERNY